MPLAPGTRLGPYEVTAKIGEGGMGEVYQARDTTLDRDVALKVLPAAFTSDPDRAARFEREAKVLASLNHPNIGGIHGFQDADGVKALVIELVEGPTLADRIKHGPIAIDDALPIARQIAEALEAAHEAGVIHRDLKPANIKVREDGTVKVLDFGLAKALDTAPDADPSQSPTLTAAATQMGVILGTAAYMSPEQARGKPVDKRADIWSFGCVLYEMLVGQRVFEATDVSLTLADVLRAEPDWTGLPDDLPAALRTYLRLCLEKDPRVRVRDIGDVRLALDGRFESARQGETAPSSRPAARGWRWVVPVGVAVAVVSGLVTGLGVWSFMRADPQPLAPTRRFTIEQPSEAPLDGSGPVLALSSDGQVLVYTARRGTESYLFRRSMDQLESVPIRDTVGASAPTLSPDGRWVLFNDDAGAFGLKKVAFAGGEATSIVERPNVAGSSWGPDDTIVFGDFNAGLFRVSANGGTPEQLTTLGADDERHVRPAYLPSGSAALFTVTRGLRQDAASTIAVYSFATNSWHELLEGAFPRYSLGHLVFSRGDSVWAVPFDPERLETTGEPFLVVDGVATLRGLGQAAHFDVASDGTLVYVPDDSRVGAGGQLSGTRTVAWMDRRGTRTPLLDDPSGYFNPRVSPDGRRLLLQRLDFETGLNTVWMHEPERQLLSAFSIDPPYNGFPIWTPDGREVTLRLGRPGSNLATAPADGSEAPALLLEMEHAQRPNSWSPDGDALLFDEEHPETGTDLWVLPADGVPRPFVVTSANELAAEFSPSGRWVAYESDASGQREIYLTPYPGPGARLQVSTDGGLRPRWSPDGNEIFYVTEGGRAMSVLLEATAPVQLGAPQELFDNPGLFVLTIDPHPDGERFAVLSESSGSTKINVVLNWLEELERPDPAN